MPLVAFAPSVPLAAVTLPPTPEPVVAMRETLRDPSAPSLYVSLAGEETSSPLTVLAPPPRRPRPVALVPMYASFVTLQVLDYHSTTSAVSQGIAREANPLVRPVVEHPAGFIMLKAGATAGIILASERMWKKHPVGAVVFMFAANSAMAVVVAHNYSIK